VELRHLRYFVAVAEEMNVTRAAVRLGIAQPPLTQQIKLLERELGVQLLVRIGRRITLSEAGRLFLAEARAVLDRAGQAIAVARSAGHGETGTLRIGFTGSAGFNPSVTSILSTFRAEWPLVSLSLEESRTSTLLDALSVGRIDAAFVRPPVNCDGIADRFVSTEPLVLAVPARHHLADRQSARLAELRNEAFVLYSRNGGYGLSEMVVAACVGAGFQPLVAQNSPQMTSTINLVAASIGIAIVPSCMRSLRPDAVRFLDIDVGFTAELRLTYRIGDASPLLRNFVAISARDVILIAPAS
jgi:DNA-binding transcriptional LysR family regulator